MYQNLFANLGPKDTVLTVNQRLSAFLKAEYKAPGACWQTPDILPLTAWLNRCWQDALMSGEVVPALLLKPQQELALWEQIIRTSTGDQQLLSTFATAKAAKQAWQLVQQWQIDLNDPIFQQSEDSAAWQSWAQAFQNQLLANQWIDNASLPTLLSKLFQEQKLAVAERIYLVGFDEINPQLQALLDALNSNLHLPLSRKREKVPAGRVRVCALPNTEIEIYTMARWAQQLPKNSRIACVVPNLNEIRTQVADIFTEVFAPESLLPGQDNTSLPFNISAGIALIDFPLMTSALQLLRLNPIISVDALRAILRSPYIAAGEQEMDARAQLDVLLRKRGETELFLRDVAVAAKQHNCPQLATVLDTVLNDTQCLTRRFAPTSPTRVREKNEKTFLGSAWAQHFVKQLKAFGWPGERILNSTEYQLLQRWQELLTEFSQLDVVLGEIDRNTALQHLQQLLHTTLFQPQTTHPAPIQILGVLESAGLPFDHLWIMGLHDQAWPEFAKPNPFIPIRLQRELQISHASSERELHFCREITTRLLQSAPEVVISYPQQDDDRQLQVSPLIQMSIQHLPTVSMDELALPPFQSFAEQIKQNTSLETFSDDYGPAITADENFSARADVFKQQAACPFRAFAQYRLGAVAMESPGPGLNARERGNLLHAVLEIVWNRIGNQAQLLNYSSAELHNVIQQSIHDGLVRFIKKHPLTLKKQFTELEKKRLNHLLHNWLQLEKQRPPFSIIAIEQSGEYAISDLPLKLRVDRIDLLEDGSHLIIDYKTGHNVSTQNWLDERPDEPQLPIYCLVSTQNVKSIAFAQLRSNEFKFSGLSETENGIKGVSPISNIKNEKTPKTWEELKQYWQKILTTLAQDFQKGYAKVDPKKGKQTCEFCDLSILCRVRN